MTLPPPSTTFHAAFSDETENEKSTCTEEAALLFDYFKHAALFKWNEGHNDCEDRANAICMLLDAWGVPNYKGWVFSGFFIKKNLGSLVHSWNFHVAALIPVKSPEAITHYMIDPSTSSDLQTIDNWALHITSFGKSFYFIKKGDIYIFPPGRIEKDNWYKRNNRNYRWTMQGLSGINGRSSIGKAYLAFNKKRVRHTEEVFKKLLHVRPLNTFLL